AGAARQSYLAAATPAVRTLVQRLENGRALSVHGLSRGAQTFLAALLHRLIPERALVLVAEGVKAQEAFHQDLETWLAISSSDPVKANRSSAEPKALFYPAWEILPHESKLPHADVISDRLETLVAL